MGEEIAEITESIVKKPTTRWFLVLVGLVLVGGILWSAAPTNTVPEGDGSNVTGACTLDSQCSENEFCRFGLCAGFTLATACEVDTDCVLIQKEQRYNCTNESVASTTWVSVNKKSFAEDRVEYCPVKDVANATSSIASLPKSDSLIASCAEKVCVIAPKPVKGAIKKK